MSVKPLHHITIMKSAVEEILTGFEASGLYTWSKTQALLALAAALHDKQGRYIQIAAMAVLSLSVEDRESLLSGYDLPTVLRAAITDHSADPGAAWPTAKPPEQTVVDLPAMRQAYAVRVRNRIDEVANQITGVMYPKAERDAWPQKQMVAQKVLDDVEPLTPAELALLEPEATARGVTVPQVAAAIMQNSDAFMPAVGQITAIRVRADAALAAAVDAAGVQAASDQAYAELDALLGS